MVSQVREEVLEPQVFKDPEDFLELLELMDPRVRLDQLVPAVHRVLLVCRACLAKEEVLVSLDLRVTGVTLERKDQRELLAKMVHEV